MNHRGGRRTRLGLYFFLFDDWVLKGGHLFYETEYHFGLKIFHESFRKAVYLVLKKIHGLLYGIFLKGIIRHRQKYLLNIVDKFSQLVIF